MKKDKPSDLPTLRKKAEKKLRDKQDSLQDLSVEDTLALIHELQVHQIELEMQNEELRNTQIELERSRKKYSDLYDFAPVGYFIFDKDGLILDVNLTGAALLGKERSLLIKKPFSLFIDKDDLDVFHKHRREVLESGRLCTCEIMLKSKTGSPIYIRLSSIPAQESEDTSGHIRTSVNDITEQKQAEKAQRASSERYRSYIDVTGHLGWTTNAEGEVVEDLPSWRKYTGQTHEEIKGWGWSKALHPEDLEHTTQIWRKALKEKSIYEVEYRIRRHDGIYRYFMARGIPVFKKDGTIREWVGTCIDITERKQAETALFESMKLNELLLDSIPYPTMLVQRDRTILAANKIAREAEAAVGEYCWKSFGRSEYISEEARLYLKGHNVESCPSCVKCSFCLADETAWSDKPAHSEVKAFGRLWDTWWVPVKDDIYLHYAIDITERKQMEAERERLIEELERSNNDLEMFAYITSHDLQEPLRMVSSYVKLLSDRYKGKLDKDADEFINYAVNGANYMKALLNDLLAYSRVGTHGEPFELTDLNVSVKTATDNLKKRIEQNNAEIKHGNLPAVHADKVQMVQVFQNLIDNAIKFCGSEPPHIQISSEWKKTEWVISIKDNCMGIDPKHFEKIFVLFKRLHPGAKYPGTGIGLAVCKKIVERHGGRIWIESEPEKGSTFYFTIPVKG
ncbi:MAG: PAS domain-containing sensor histidine kinase [Nitrospiraceae bacterium]|nr:MAG: PAS domain-containing sensor histidine kinase [Nitrospiraceae bacterium]